jgi:hypothetical protein
LLLERLQRSAKTSDFGRLRLNGCDDHEGANDSKHHAPSGMTGPAQRNNPPPPFRRQMEKFGDVTRPALPNESESRSGDCQPDDADNPPP